MSAAEPPLTLFDNFARAETRPARNDEPAWVYMNLSARPGVAAARNVLEDWFSHYAAEPHKERLDLRSRFRNRDRHQHRSAFFELYVHELLRRAGYEIESHPETTRTTHPDYKVLRNGQPRFYLEVIMPRAQDEPDPGARMRFDQFIEGLNKITSPDFFLWIEHKGYPKKSPSTKDVRKQIEEWLSGLNREEVKQLIVAGSDIRAAPKLKIKVEDMVLTIRPLPRDRNKPPHPHDRSVAAVKPDRAMMLDTTGAIRRAVSSKAKKYGPLDLPYIIAIGVQDVFVDDVEDAVAALIGRESLTVHTATDGQRHDEWGRQTDGVWWDGTSPVLTQVSAVLVAFDPSPWSLAKNEPVLIHHPWARRRMRVTDWPLNQYVAELTTGTYHFRKGRHIGRYLGLPKEWPVPDPEEAN